MSCPVARRGLTLSAACATCEDATTAGQVKLRPGQRLFDAGSPARALFPVVDGLVLESIATADGRVQHVRLVRPGQLTGLAALGGGDHTVTAEAVGRVRACRVDVAQALAEAHRAPEVLRALLRDLQAELEGAHRGLLRLGRLTAEERILSLLVELGGERLRAGFVLPLSRAALADLLGLSMFTVSRTLRKLERDGAIVLRGRKIIGGPTLSDHLPS